MEKYELASYKDEFCFLLLIWISYGFDQLVGELYIDFERSNHFVMDRCCERHKLLAPFLLASQSLLSCDVSKIHNLAVFIIE